MRRLTIRRHGCCDTRAARTAIRMRSTSVRSTRRRLSSWSPAPGRRSPAGRHAGREHTSCPPAGSPRARVRRPGRRERGTPRVHDILVARWGARRAGHVGGKWRGGVKEDPNARSYHERPSLRGASPPLITPVDPRCAESYLTTRRSGHPSELAREPQRPASSASRGGARVSPVKGAGRRVVARGVAEHGYGTAGGIGACRKRAAPVTFPRATSFT